MELGDTVTLEGEDEEELLLLLFLLLLFEDVLDLDFLELFCCVSKFA